MLDFHNDSTFKIQYDPQSQMFQFQRNAVGAHSYIEIEEADYTYTDSNSIFVSDTSGNDSTGSGTQAAPYKTILKGCGECTATKSKCIVLDSVLYSESLSTLNNSSFAGLYAATGETPTLSLRTLDYTPSDSNTIFYATTGNDSTGDGSQATPYATPEKAAENVDGTHQAIQCLDSGSYNFDGLQGTGNFLKWTAALGHKPTHTLNQWGGIADYSEGSTIKSETVAKSGTSAVPLFTCELGNGNVLVLYYEGLVSVYYFKIYSSVGEVVVSETANTINNQYCVANGDCFYLFDTTGTMQERANDGTLSDSHTILSSGTICDCPVLLTTGDILVLYVSGVNLYYKIIDTDGNDVVSGTLVYTASGAIGVCKYCRVSSGWAFAVACSDANNMQIYNNSGAQLYQATNANLPGYFEMVFNGTYLSLVYYDSSSDLKLCFYDGTLTAHGSAVTITTNNCVGISSAASLNNGDIFISFVDNDDSDYGKYCIYNSSGAAVKSITTFSTNTLYNSTAGFRKNIACLTNNNVFFSYFVDGLTDIYYQVLFLCNFYAVDCDAAFTCNGISLDLSNATALSAAFRAVSAKLTLKNIDILSGVNSNNSSTYCYAVYSDDEIDIQNCRIAGNDKGVYTVDNDATIKNNVIYWNTYGYGVHIDGTGSGIDIQHNTFFSGYGGVKVESNDGTEVIKNNIFYDNSQYDVDLENAGAFTYSVYSGEISDNTSAGASVIKSNPLFVNEGAITPANIDLTLKLRVLGYPADSPAYLLADDTVDRDAGCYDNIVIGEETTWTEIELPKPYNNFKPSLEFVGATEVVKDDGTVETSVTGYTETVTISYPDGLEKTYYDDVLAMFVCGENQVRLYPDPTTSPSDYNLYNINYKGCKLPRDAGHYKLGDSGVKGLVIELVRGYS